MKDRKPVVLQVYCRLEVVVDDPESVLGLAGQRLREADIDWSSERQTMQEAVDELRGELAQSVASLLEPDRMVEDVPGMEVRGGRYWAEVGGPSERFQPGFDAER